MRWLKRLVPPIVTGLGLAIMEVTFHSMLGYHPTPLLIRLVAGITSPFFIGMALASVGAYLHSLNTRRGVAPAIASITNTLAWEDVWYWVVLWQAPHPWVFRILGLGIPYVVYYNVPVITITVLALTTFCLIRHPTAGVHCND